MASNHVTPRAFLAKQMQRLRAAKGISREELARMLPVSDALVRAWETSRRLPQPDHLGKLEEIFDTKGILAAIREDLVKAPVPLEWFGKWPEIESQASSLWDVETTVIPGLLQIEEYARIVLRAAQHSADLEEMVSRRMGRQSVLTKEDPPMFVALIAESVLRNNVGGAQVMADQLDHIAQMAQHENVVVQVIPDNARSRDVLIAPFVIACMDSVNIAYVDNQLNGEVIEDADDVARLLRMFDRVRADALSQEESIALIARMADKWRS